MVLRLYEMGPAEIILVGVVYLVLICLFAVILVYWL